MNKITRFMFDLITIVLFPFLALLEIAYLVEQRKKRRLQHGV
jgi:hypothetical protein